eukprot:SAG11_NODE_4619_length_1832_cov_1.834391_1_plen_96_part_10
MIGAVPPHVCVLCCTVLACQAVAAAASVGKGGMVVFVGGLNGTFNFGEGEGHDRTTLALPGYQEELMVATHAASKPAGATFVVVLVGSPVTANWAQ